MDDPATVAIVESGVDLEKALPRLRLCVKLLLYNSIE